jgi:hypothetical protein
MRRSGWVLGVVLLVVAAALGVARLIAWLMAARAGDVTLGSIWAGVSANSLVGLQAFVEGSLSPALWPPILWALLLPAWLVLGCLGLILLGLCRRRSRFY